MNNKIKRKVFALFLSLTMVVTMTPTMTIITFAGQEVPGGEIEKTGGYGEMPPTQPEDEEGYEIDEDGTIKVKDGYVITTVAGVIVAGASLTGGATYFIKKIGDKNHETSGGTTIVVDEDHNVEYETDPQPTDEGGGTTADPEEKTDTSAAQKALVNKTAIKLNTLTAYKNGKIKLSFNRATWDKSNGKKVKTYQIYRSTKKNSGFKRVATITNSKTSKTVTYTNSKSLKKGKRYYYKVRGRIKLSNGKYAYTKWSNVKSIKCKKTR